MSFCKYISVVTTAWMQVTVMVMTLSDAAAAATTPASVLRTSFTWSDCGNANSSVRVSSVSVSPAPLTIPGQASVSLEASVLRELGEDVLVIFNVKVNSTFGPTYMQTIPCVQGQGSCAYKLCDLLALNNRSSAVSRQLVTALRAGGLASASSGCPVQPGTISLSDVAISIPNMLQSPLDLLVSTNNYFVRTTFLSGSDEELGCLQLNMPVRKTCLGWSCPKGIDHAIQVIKGDN